MKKNSVEIYGYKHFPLCDNHVHITFDRPIEDTVDTLRTIMNRFCYDKIQICSLPYYDITENYKAFYIKSVMSPAVYVSAGIEHHYDERDTEDYYLEEIKRYRKMGCDGIKMFEGKMKVHRKLGRKLCDPVFDKFYEYAQEHKIPIVIHLGDHLDMWDKSKCSQYAIDRGWYCDENDPTREDLRAEIDAVMEKFPKLYFIFAHFYFMSDDLERAAEFLEKWENVCFDLTPGGHMFKYFTERFDEWREFFVRFQDRILYGTDTYNGTPASEVRVEKYIRINLVRSYLEKKEIFIEESVNSPLKPFELPEEILEKIYYKNFIRLYGENPRMLDKEEIAKGCISARKKAELTPIADENLKKISSFFSKQKGAPNMKRYFFIDSPKGIYSSPKDVEGGSVNDKTDIFKAGCNVIYDIYDDLAERFCDYVNKVKIGEVSGYDYNRYTFSNYDIENASSFPVKPFKIILITAVHGYEPGCAWTAAQFFKLMCENPDDEILGFLRRNVVFEVLPIANPYGFANNKRANENDTDINRNFDCDWVSLWNNKDHYGYYAGDFPHSELETRLIIEFLKENSDAEWMIDYHNISKPYPLFYVNNEEIVQLAYSVFSSLTYKWQKEYEGLEKGRILGSVKKSGQGGMLAKYARGKLGIKSFILETPEMMQGISDEMYDKNTIKTALEVLVNTIIAIVKS